jgi:hypothetical protein
MASAARQTPVRVRGAIGLRQGPGGGEAGVSGVRMGGEWESEGDGNAAQKVFDPERLNGG